MKPMWIIKLRGSRLYLGPNVVNGTNHGAPQWLSREDASRFSSEEAARRHLGWVIANYPGPSYQRARLVKLWPPGERRRQRVLALEDCLRDLVVGLGRQVMTPEVELARERAKSVLSGGTTDG